jgi:hypothetical protein
MRMVGGTASRFNYGRDTLGFIDFNAYDGS